MTIMLVRIIFINTIIANISNTIFIIVFLSRIRTCGTVVIFIADMISILIANADARLAGVVEAHISSRTFNITYASIVLAKLIVAKISNRTVLMSDTSLLINWGRRRGRRRRGRRRWSGGARFFI